MAFFGDLGKAIAGAGQTAVNKTKDLTEITRLSARVSDLQRKNEQLYATIGKLYLEHYGDDPEDMFKGAVLSIKENQKKIVSYKEDIKQIKGIKKCASCDADVPSGSQFCPKCGAKVEDDDIVADVEAVVVDDDMVVDEDVQEAPVETAEADEATAEAENTTAGAEAEEPVEAEDTTADVEAE